ncbi:MAG: ABC transporter permease [Planctomycetaceae bacterium]|nr:ABC transporter permease [Planctomycetaceae bacterium]
MRALWPFARRSLLGRRGRTALLIAAVALATSLVVAVTSGLRTAQASLEASIARAMGETDARVIHRYAEPFDRALLEEVRGWPGVERAAGRLFASITLENPAARDAGDRARRATVQARGVMPDEDAFFREVEIEAGRRVERAGEVVLDPQTAAALAAKPGDTLRIARFGKPIEVVVAGIYKRPVLGALQRPLVEIDLATLSDATKRAGKLTSISIALAEGTDTEAWCAERAKLLRDPILCEPAERVRTGLDKQVAASELSTLIATMIAFLSCAAIVATGMTTAVLEELREMGVARAIGATRRQLFGAQVLVGGVIGLAGGVLGVPLGVALVAILAAVYDEFIKAGVAVDPRGVALAIAGALIAGLLGALFPAFRAARISPLEALAIRAREPGMRPIVLASLAALGAIGVWALGLLPESRDTRFWLYVFGGLPLLHVAWFLLSVPVTLGVSRIASPVLERVLALPRGLLAGSIARMPWRLGCTAGALMVAVSILVSTRSNGDAIIQDLRERVRFADGFVFSTSGLSKAEQARIRTLPGVTDALPVGYLPLKIAGEQVFGVEGMGPTNVVCVGFEPRPFLEMNRLDWLEGTPETAIPRLEEGDAILVAPEFLVARGLGVGSRLRLGSGANEAEFEIVGVVTAAGLDIATQTFGMRQIYMEQAVSCVFMDFGAVERHFDTRDAYIMQLRLAAGLDESGEKVLGEAVADAVPGAVFSSGRAIRGFVEEIGGTVLAVTSAVALAALALAAIGVGSVVAAGISARMREFGILRAVGGSTRVLVALVLGETIVMAIASLVSGTALGLMLAWMGVELYRDFAGLRLAWIIPTGPIASGAAIVVVVALLAALPAVLRLARKPTRELVAGA